MLQKPARQLSLTPQAGFTLVELMIVMLILVALAGIAVTLMGSTISDTESKATQVSLNNLRGIIMGHEQSPGYWGDLRQLPQSMADLSVLPTYLPASQQGFDPNTRRGWRGPYVQNESGRYALNVAKGFTASYGNADDPAVLDGWSHPIILQTPTVGTPDQQSLYARLVSAGPDGVITTPSNVLYPPPVSRGDDIVIFLRRADAP